MYSTTCEEIQTFQQVISTGNPQTLVKKPMAGKEAYLSCS
jgi:hypothetical protein